MKNKIVENKKGFTLIEMLVVVLIIGILAGISLPQYQMAVTKAKVASILPLMRRWKDALQEYKLQHGSYEVEDYESVDASWPSDWDNGSCGNSFSCSNDYWSCNGNTEDVGMVYCSHHIDENNWFLIEMFQPDDEAYTALAGMTACEHSGTEGEKVCKALGGKLLENYEDLGYTGSTVYKLN